MNREVRDNLYNQHSSRGHSIFQITLRKNVLAAEPSSGPGQGPSSNPPPQSRLSRLFFVDLACVSFSSSSLQSAGKNCTANIANLHLIHSLTLVCTPVLCSGSEKWHVNGGDLSDKYAGELASINRSLSALTNCVLALTQKERVHIPFRDSILTRLLQSCLQGAGRTTFIVTISPAKESLEESFATLRFAERLKALRCRPIRRKVFSSDLMGDQRLYYEQQIQTMRVSECASALLRHSRLDLAAPSYSLVDLLRGLRGSWR